MQLTHWYLIIGMLLVLLVVVGAWVKRQPMTTAMFYLALGWGMGRLGWLELNPIHHAAWLEHLSEIAVIISLFTAGLKLRWSLRSGRWRLPLLLAFGAMTLTVGLIALAGQAWLGLPLGAAIILGAVIAPTDPVLASDVQVEHSRDRDRLRFTLTGEAGFNDGTAFPFVMLGLGVMGLHELGAVGWRWWTLDVLWPIAGGLALGAALGMAVARWVVHLRRQHHEAIGTDEFLALGLIALAYGLALLMHVYGFLAVFAAGLALRNVERELSPDDAPDVEKAVVATDEELASHSKHAPAFMAASVLHFNEQVERIAECALVLIAGALLAAVAITWSDVGFAAVVLLVVRPIAIAPFLVRSRLTGTQMGLVAWFGVRGIGSMFYLFHVIRHDMPEEIATRLAAITLCVIALSICLHGLTTTPLMRLYRRRCSGDSGEQLCVLAIDRS